MNYYYIEIFRFAMIVKKNSEMSQFNKYILPGIIIVLGMLITIIGISQGQNNLFLIGGVGMIVVGGISLLGLMSVLSSKLQMVLIAILALLSISLIYLDYKSIKDPIDFIKKRDARYLKVEQRLKDIRKAQIIYKSVHGKYCDNFNDLLSFIKNDSLFVVNAIGMVPDTLSEDSAVILGIVSRDTMLVPVRDSVFSKRYLASRINTFNIDSLPYVPFTKTKFKIDAGHIEKNNVTVPVFLVEDSKPFDPKLVYRVGSMTEPITTGNWE